MRLTTKGEYSLLALIYIARHGKSGFVKIGDICAAYDIPSKYVEQLLLILKGARYIKTKCGIKGGYQLAKPANKITVAEIVRLLDGMLAPSEAVSDCYYAPHPVEKEKKLLKVLRDIQQFISKKLETLTIQDLR